MSNDSQNLSLGEVANRFLATLALAEIGTSQQEIYKFVRWFGGERLFAELAGGEIDNYAERLSTSDKDYIKKLKMLRIFLVYAKKQGWSKTNLATHLKTRKGKTRVSSSSRQSMPETILLTQNGYDELKTELAVLYNKRPQAIEEIRKAAADKDFRENVPFHAAREKRGQLEGRIKELEETLKLAVVINEAQKSTLKVGIGDCVIVCDLGSGEELRYTLVSPREVDPVKGKISNASPIGQAIVDRGQGEIVEISVPAGKLRYQIKQIER